MKIDPENVDPMIREYIIQNFYKGAFYDPKKKFFIPMAALQYIVLALNGHISPNLSPEVDARALLEKLSPVFINMARSEGKQFDLCYYEFYMITDKFPRPQSEAGAFFLHLLISNIERYYFPPGDGWQRVKVCLQCNSWFLDNTKNKTKCFCSGRCKNRWWSWSRRKESGHNIQK
jgi:hypothetical protein